MDALNTKIRQCSRCCMIVSISVKCRFWRDDWPIDIPWILTNRFSQSRQWKAIVSTYVIDRSTTRVSSNQTKSSLLQGGEVDLRLMGEAWLIGYTLAQTNHWALSSSVTQSRRWLGIWWASQILISVRMVKRLRRHRRHGLVVWRSRVRLSQSVTRPKFFFCVRLPWSHVGHKSFLVTLFFLLSGIFLVGRAPELSSVTLVAGGGFESHTEQKMVTFLFCVAIQ